MESVFCSFVCVSGTCANKKYDSGTCSTLRFPPGEYCRLGVLSFFLNPQKKGYRYNVPTFIYFRLFLCCFFDRLIGLSLVFFFFSFFFHSPPIFLRFFSYIYFFFQTFAFDLCFQTILHPTRWQLRPQEERLLLQQLLSLQPVGIQLPLSSGRTLPEMGLKIKWWNIINLFEREPTKSHPLSPTQTPPPNIYYTRGTDNKQH